MELKSQVFIKCICLDQLDVCSSLNGPTVEFSEATANADGEWKLCKFTVKSALLLGCFEIIPLGLCTVSLHVNKMPQMLALEILRDVPYYFYGGFSLSQPLSFD